ncbi:MAG: pyruvate oxidase [Lactobacillales bacterium]|jgi:pyruvate oxidase|nr:pyruvate oxidase [Lactobacillales bacterium]
MTAKTINAAVKMVEVLSDWGIDHIYGIPGGSFNSTMDALFQKKDKVKYIQVRHEEVGAIAAAADSKLTGKIGVVFGSAGPGGTHLMNGLYDAMCDHVPVLALIGQTPASQMNRYAFQEINENPIYADVSVYNRVVMTPEQLPIVVDNAIKEAYAKKGVAVVTIPVDYGQVEISDVFVSSAHTHKISVLLPKEVDIDAALVLLAQAKKPYLYIGQGISGAREVVKQFSEQFSIPVGASVLAKGVFPDEHENFMGMSGRVAWKTGNEASIEADLIIFVGSDFPFAENFFNPKAKFIQIDIDSAKFGRRHSVDVAILGDAKLTLQRMIEKGESRTKDEWLEANRENKKNWWNWRHSFDYREGKNGLLRVEPIYAEISRIADDEAIFVVDVGNVTLNSVRHLEMRASQKFTTSGWFATMGYGIPGGIAAKLSYPDRQVFTLSGDGGFAMMLMGLITQAQYRLPIINIVQTNRSFGFIEGEQEDTGQSKFGVFLDDVDFATVASGMGIESYTVRSINELRQAMDAAKKIKDLPIVIDVKVDDSRPLPVENLKLDPKRYSEEEIVKFKERYEARDLLSLKELLKG